MTVSIPRLLPKFMEHFCNICSSADEYHSKSLYDKFSKARENYTGVPFTTDHSFDVELISRIIDQLQRDKAAGLDNIMAEHLQYSHPVLSCVGLLMKLFNLMLECAYTRALLVIITLFPYQK